MNKKFTSNNTVELIGLNTVIFPDDKTRNKIIEWSRLVVRHFPTYFTLNTQDYLPHLSLYNSQFPLKNKRLIEQAVKEIAHKQEPFEIEFSGFSPFSGFIFYDVVSNKILQSLHEDLVLKLNPLREGNIPEVLNTLTGLSERHKIAIKEYGSVSVMDLYMPHITVSRLINPDLAKEAINLLLKEAMRFTASEIVIAPFSEHGTCSQPLLKFPFNSF